MKRRKVLKSLGLGLSAGLIMPQFLTACKKSDPGPEVPFNGTVAVIGAGAAGLYAADILRSKGISVIVFEAGSSVGGRIRSYHAPNSTEMPTESFLFVPADASGDTFASVADFPLELGPETVSGSDSIWGKIISDLTIRTVDISNPVNRFILDNTAKLGADWSADPDYIAVETFVAGLAGVTAAGTSVRAASGVSDRGAALLNSQAGNWYGSTADTIDAGALGAAVKLASASHDSKTLTLIGTLMQDVLKTRFTNVATTVKLNTAVTSIDYGGDTITIGDSAGGSTVVQKVIVTVPLSLMKSGAIGFNPGLPSAMVSSLAKLGMDDCVRVILDFKVNFWGDATTGYIWGGTESPQYFNAGYGRSENYKTLTLTICGPKATELSAMGADMITPILAELDAIYNGQASKNIRQTLPPDPDPDNPTPPPPFTPQNLYTIQDWSKEVYIKGGFSYPMVGASNDDRVAIGAPINQKLFFAGEATDVTGNAGTVNGALASAERVAMEVVKSITG